MGNNFCYKFIETSNKADRSKVTNPDCLFPFRNKVNVSGIGNNIGTPFSYYSSNNQHILIIPINFGRNA